VGRKVFSLSNLRSLGRRLARGQDEEVRDGAWFRTPDDLSRTETKLGRIIIIGSCLAEIFGLFAPVRKSRVDFTLFNHTVRLANAPPHPLGEYSFQVIQFPLRDLLSDQSYFRLPFSEAEPYEELFDNAVARMRQMLDGAMRWNLEHGMLTFVMNFLPPQQNPMGKLLPRCDLRNFTYFIGRLNDVLSTEVARYSNAFILDVDQVSATLGRRYFQDDSIYALNHGSGISEWDHDRDRHRLTAVEKVINTYQTRMPETMRAIWAEAESMYRIVQQIDLVKLVIIDLDDTLWRGLVVEDQSFNTDTTEGWPLGFVEALLFLKKRGTLLAIASKNEHSKVEEIWDSIWLDRLKLEDFAVIKINWKTKGENVANIIDEAGLLPGNVVFIDDNPVERALIEQSFPGIRVLGSDPYVLRRILLWSSETQAPSITDVSSRRTELVQVRASVEKLRSKLSREQFLNTLNLRLSVFEIQSIDDPRFARAFELLNKTNQFNTTGRRLTTQECASAFRDGTVFYVFEVTDKFTRYGLVSVGIVADNEIQQFVLSCRVIGLDVEIAAVGEICARLRDKGASAVKAAFVETSANGVCRNLFADCGFDRLDQLWVLAAGQACKLPAHIELA
jgi:FkbH-like protein